MSNALNTLRRERAARRGGFALMLVLVFLVLLLSLWSISYRQIASALRIQTLRSQFISRNQGNLLALAQGMTLLESGSPPANPYVCATTILSPSGALTSYTLTFTSESNDIWSVDAALTGAGESPDPMPGTFAPPDPL